ncbi:MAG: pseudouridine synthase [Myxococcota bacterium]|nr:pseudouridine synthase [Myxococcota bacterium]
MRLSKLIAARGVASRREAETLVREGVVTVNGTVADHPGQEVDPEQDHVKVRGKRLPPARPPVTLALHKPAGCVTTREDPQDRPTVFDLLDGTRYHGSVEPVGRLDFGTEGLLLLSSDGELAHRLTHPRYHVAKLYRVKITGTLNDRKLALLRKGVPLSDGRTAPAIVRVTEARERNSWLDVTVREGRNRLVRRMVEHVGHKVLRLKRTAVGRLRLADLPRGEFRTLAGDEVKLLWELTRGQGEEEFARALARQRSGRNEPPTRRSRRKPRPRGRRR